MKGEYVIGIDLGTTNSCVSIMECIDIVYIQLEHQKLLRMLKV